MSDRIWLWFADNGNIRKWQHEPFPEGAEYVVAALADAELEEMTRSCLAERTGAASLRSKLEEAEGALKAAREFIADEFNDDRYEEFGEWLSPEARDVHKQLCEAEVALSALREADHA